MDLPTAIAETPLRWSTFTPAAAGPAVESALAAARARLEAIEAQPAAPTWDNLLGPYDEILTAVGRPWTLVSHLNAVADSPEWRAVYERLQPAVTDFFTSLPLRPALWARLRALASSPAGAALTGSRRRFLEETVEEFRQSGADLSAEDQSRLLALEEELASTTRRYAQNALDSRNAWEHWETDAARLAGLPESALAAARQDAARRGRPEAWRFTLQAPSVTAVLTYAHDPDLRRLVWEAVAAIAASGPWDNTALVRRILALRADKARLLGFADFADYATSRRMARSGARALAFVEDLHHRVAAPFAREVADLEELRRARSGASGRLAPWDVNYWVEQLRRERYAFDAEAVRPYLPLPRVLAGLFEIVRRLFGVTVVDRTGAAETWHPDVRFYELIEEDGTVRGQFYTDWHPRETKRGGAWFSPLRTGCPPQPPRPREPHVGVICGNLTPPVGDRPALLTHAEVSTVFHEFGHLLHHLLGEVEVRALSGTEVAWDFVELPSQILENWIWEREPLDLCSAHHETGEALPSELLGRMQAARRFASALLTMRQLSFAKVDLELHRRGPEAVAGDLDAAARSLLAGYLVPTSIEPPFILRNFGHLFAGATGYAGGYYSYKWAEVLDADAFDRFRAAGLFDRTTGQAFREAVLAAGNSAPPEALFRRFVGRDPDLQPFLRRSGLA